MMSRIICNALGIVVRAAVAENESVLEMPLFHRENLSPEAREVADSFNMINSSPEFDDESAVAYMERNRAHFAEDADNILSRLNLSRS